MIQNDHVSRVTLPPPDGKTDGLTYDKGTPPEYNNVIRYSTPDCLMQIMR